MDTNAKALDQKEKCSCGTTTNDNRPFLSRLWQFIDAWERAMEYSGYDDLLARLNTLEREVSLLRAELEGRQSHADCVH